MTFDAQFFVATTIAIFSLGMAFFTLHKSPNRQVSLSFFLLVAALSAWILSSMFADVFINYQAALWSSRLAMVGPILSCPIFLYICWVFPEQSRILSKKLFFFALLPAVLLLLLVPTSYNVPYVRIEEWGTFSKSGILYDFFDYFFLGYLGAGFTFLIMKFRQTQETMVRQQLRVFLLASFLLFSIGFLTNSFLPRFFSYAQGSVYGPSLAILLFSLLTSYAILRFKFLDITVVVRRALLAFFGFVLLASLMSVFSYSIFRFSAQTPFLIVVFSALALAILSFKNRFDRFLRRIFPEERINIPDYFENRLRRRMLPFEKMTLHNVLRQIQERSGVPAGLFLWDGGYWYTLEGDFLVRVRVPRRLDFLRRNWSFGSDGLWQTWVKRSFLKRGIYHLTPVGEGGSFFGFAFLTTPCIGASERVEEFRTLIHEYAPGLVSLREHVHELSAQHR